MTYLSRFYALMLIVAMGFSATAPPSGQATAAPAGKSDAPPADVPLAEGKGRDVAKRICGSCHSTNVWATQHQTRDQWSGVIDNMISKGADGTDEEFAQILDYLSTDFAPPKDGDK